jgi:hypothetical protein
MTDLDDLFKGDFTRVQRPGFRALLWRGVADLIRWEREGQGRSEVIMAVEHAWALLRMWVQEPPTEDDEVSMDQEVRFQVARIIGRANALDPSL